MCLIVVKNKADASFSVEDFKTSFGRNNDGTGIMYIEEGRIKTERVMGAYDKHLEMYYPHMNRPQFILHQRFATHGTNSIDNVHPFKVLSIDEGDPYDLYMAHNGVISPNKLAGKTTTDSDTSLFVQEFMTPLLKLNPELLSTIPFQIMLHDFIGSFNKLAFLRNDGELWIFNERQGGEHNGCWLSNKASVIPDKVTTYNYGTQHGTHMGYNSTLYSEYNDSREYYGQYAGDDEAWRNHWNKHNDNKTKIVAATNTTGYSADELIDYVSSVAGMTLKTIEDLVLSDPGLVKDIIEFLVTPATFETDIMEQSSDKIAEKLHDLMQDFMKKAA